MHIQFFKMDQRIFAIALAEIKDRLAQMTLRRRRVEGKNISYMQARERYVSNISDSSFIVKR